MTTYKGLKGTKIQNITSDAIASQALGGSWASGGNTNTGVDAAGYCGIQTAAMYFGGRGGSPITTRIDTSETYNGSSWTETNDLQTATYQNAGFGTTSAAISAGGLSPSATTAVETFDGTNWAAAPGSLNGAKRQVRGTGTQTAGMVAFATPSPQRQLTELYDGSTWTESGDTNNPKIGVPLVGVTTAALAIGGQNPSDQGSTDCETFNGSVWAVAAGTMNDGRINAGGAGSTTAGLVFGGYGGGGSTVATANTETYDGTTWAEGANLATARDFILSGQASPNTTALAFGGQVPPSATVSNSTEEWTAPATFRQFSIGDIYYNADPSSGVIKYVGYGTGAWASGATVGTARAALEGADGSSVPAGLIMGGRTTGSAGSGQTEEYNGTAWSEQNDLNVDRWRGGGAGTQTAGFSFAGSTAPTTHVKTAETYDGTSWTEVNDTNSNHVNTIGFGTTTAAFCVAGNSGTANIAIVESYDGSSWTETTDINTARNATSGSGTTTAAIIAGGETPGARVTNAEQWNGTSWTEVGDLNEARIHLGGTGTSSSSIVFGGEPGPAVSAKTEQWDGSSWTEIADLSTARARGGSGGNALSAFFAAGATPSATAGVNPTEEWSTPTELKTLASTTA